MRKNDRNKQKRSMMISTAAVIAGCIATAVYVNQTMNTASDYKIDLSQVGGEQSIQNSIVNDPELSSGASLARVNGYDVVNTEPEGEISVKVQEETENIVASSEEKEQKPEKESAEDKEVSSTSVVMQAAELSFSEEEGMGWPLVGDVILNYSMDSAVYFETLMQYKYNPAILISAQQGDQVSAAVKGQVVKIGESAEFGQYVVMNAGNGYEVTYGQLESLQVQEGSVVSRGQVIGSVAKTTKYYSVEGDHIYLKITKDGEPVDPLSLMQ